MAAGAVRRPPYWAVALLTVTAMVVAAGPPAAAARRAASAETVPAQIAALRSLPSSSGSEVVVDRGIRGVLFIDFVEWTLYRDRKSGSMTLAVRILYAELPDEMPGSLHRIFVRNLSAEKLGIMEAFYGTLRKSDVVVVACGDAGCRFSVNGREILAVPGFDLFGDLANYVTGHEIVPRPTLGD